MTRASLAKRVEQLEQKHGSGECYIKFFGFMDLRVYRIEFKSELPPGYDYSSLTGPFPSFQDAVQWRVRDIKARYLQAYEELIKTNRTRSGMPVDFEKKEFVVAVNGYYWPREPMVQGVTA